MTRRNLTLGAAVTAVAVTALSASAEELLFLRPWATATRHLEEGYLHAPTGVCFDDEADELWIADTQNNLLGLFTPDGTPVFATNGGGSLNGPESVTVGPRGELWVLDNDRTRVVRLDYRGNPLPPPRLAGLPDAPVIGAIAFDGDGNLYVGENSEGRIHVYDATLDPWFRFGSFGYENEQFVAITDITVSDDRIAVLDAVGRPVQIFNRRGELERAFGDHAIGVANFSLPQGVAFDSAGRVIVVDALRHEIKFFDDRGRFLGRFGGYGSGPGQVKAPIDIAIDASDRLYVAEKGNGRVQIFQIELIERPAPAPGPQGGDVPETILQLDESTTTSESRN